MRLFEIAEALQEGPVAGSYVSYAFRWSHAEYEKRGFTALGITNQPSDWLTDSVHKLTVSWMQRMVAERVLASVHRMGLPFWLQHSAPPMLVIGLELV